MAAEQLKDTTKVIDGVTVHFHRNEIVIVGAGGAGMRAAIEAAEQAGGGAMIDVCLLYTSDAADE